MKDLIEALQILLKYANDDRNPTHCEHDQLYVGCGIAYESVTKKILTNLMSWVSFGMKTLKDLYHLDLAVASITHNVECMASKPHTKL